MMEIKEEDVKGSEPNCIRILILVNNDKEPKEEV